jgi:hypothetical protein
MPKGTLPGNVEVTPRRGARYRHSASVMAGGSQTCGKGVPDQGSGGQAISDLNSSAA